jgi:hypothetical protein
MPPKSLTKLGLDKLGRLPTQRELAEAQCRLIESRYRAKWDSRAEKKPRSADRMRPFESDMLHAVCKF